MRLTRISLVWLMFVGMMVLFAPTVDAHETLTIRGYFCGDEDGGNAFAYKKLRAGDSIFEYQYSVRHVRLVGMKKKNANKIGAEYIVRYRRDGEANWAESITFTGRRKNIKPC